MALLADADVDKDAGEVAAAVDTAETVPLQLRLQPAHVPPAKGNTKEMNGHVIQCFNKWDDKKQFSKTVEAAGEYIAKKLKYPGNMDSLTKELVLPTIPKLEELDQEETNLLLKAIWNKKVTSYCTRTDYLESTLKTAYAVFGVSAAKP